MRIKFMIVMAAGTMMALAACKSSGGSGNGGAGGEGDEEKEEKKLNPEGVAACEEACARAATDCADTCKGVCTSNVNCSQDPSSFATVDSITCTEASINFFSGDHYYGCGYVASPATSSTTTSTGSGGDCDGNITCADAITTVGAAEQLCSGTASASFYDTLVECTCSGACASDCGDSTCLGEAASDWCIGCLQDTDFGCGNEFNDCSNDI